MKLLLATDGSAPAEAAARFLASLPLATGSAMRVLAVMDALGWQSPDWLKEAEWRSASEAVAAAQNLLARDGITVEPLVREGQPAYEVLRAAEEFEADLIVVGSEGRTGVRGFLIGSVARNVAQNAAQPVLVARSPRAGMRTAVLAIDASEHAKRAVEVATSLPLPPQTELVIASVIRPYQAASFSSSSGDAVAGVQQLRRRDAAALIEKARSSIAAAGRSVSVAIREGDPAAAILDLAAERDADLILAGARGVSLVSRLSLGSVADRLLKAARCSVLVAR